MGITVSITNFPHHIFGAVTRDKMTEQEALKKNLQRRNGHRLVARNTIAKVNELLPPIGQELNATPAVRVKLESYQSSLENKRATIASLNNEIEKRFDQQDIEKGIVERSTFEEEIEEVICKLNAALTRPQAQVSETAVTTRPSIGTIKVKLPKLSLPYFDGNPTQWTAYWDSFKSTIHNHPDLSKVDKLKYLQTSLTGDAAQTISGFQITSKNYDEAIELLEKRFGNKQIIISRHN